MDSGLDVAQLEIKLLEVRPFPGVQGLAQFHLDPEVLYGEGHCSGPRKEPADKAHFPLGFSFNLLSPNVDRCIYLYKENRDKIFLTPTESMT